MTSDIPSWIDAKLFEKVLNKSVPNFKEIKEFSVYNALPPGENYVAVALKIKIIVMLTDYSLLTHSYFLKVAQNTELYHTQLCKWNVFNKETEMYRVFIPDFEQLYREVGVNLRFGAEVYDLPIHEEYLLLEDLGLQGFKNVNRQNSLDMEHSKIALKKLAQWHAASAVRVEFKGCYNDIYLKGALNPDGEPLVRAMCSSAIQNVLLACKDMTNSELYYEQLEKLSVKFPEFLLENITYNPNEFNVLNHGDFWCNNVMFQYNEAGKVNDAYIVDYQMARYGSPGHDLIYFMISSVKLNLKVAHFDELIKYYHKHLIANLKLLKYTKPVPSLGDIHKMIMESRAYGKF